MTNTPLILCMLPLGALAMEPELWLVELEHNDGIRLQFQGAELELGSADLVGIDGPDALRPGMRLAIESRHGVAELIHLLSRPPSAAQSGQWSRAEDRLLAVVGQTLLLQELGVLVLDTQTRWLNGSPADLQVGRRLVLTRDEEGRLTEVLIPNPEEDPE
ncbi:MAG: hypothetical protein ACRCYW_19690 [Aeromonas sp.]|uniref:hypothetical protein n=1 Tax=Aeromonas sp. TaxID=647 RepID=UPI003F3D2A19